MAVVTLMVAVGAVWWLPARGGPWPGDDWAVVVCDVGQGESLLVRSGPTSAVVIDTGARSAGVQHCLRRSGITTVPLLVLTHLHEDHVGDLDAVAGVAQVQQVWTAPSGMPAEAEAQLAAWAGSQGVTVHRPAAGVSMTVGEVQVDVLAPEAAGTGATGTGTAAGTGDAHAAPGDSQDVNDAGLVTRLSGDLTVLVLGDIGAEVQQRLLRTPSGVVADVITIAHHGSSDQSPELYEAVAARVAVASAGATNTYGHPSERALRIAADSGAVVLSTVDHGDIALRAVPAGPDEPVTIGVRVSQGRPRPTRACQHGAVVDQQTGRGSAGRGRAAPTSGATPFDVEPAPVVLLVGTEQALADIAWRRLLAAVREQTPDVERHELGPTRFAVGDVSAAVAPSLFGGRRLVALSGLEAAAGPYSDEVTAVASELAEQPDEDLILIGRHAGGNGGKAVLTALAQVPGAIKVACAPVSNDRDRVELVSARLRAVGRRAEPAAVHVLVESLGGDLAELLAITGQLADIVPAGMIGLDDVRALVGGRREAGGFDIADAAVAGRAGEALSLLRHALSQRVEPVLVVGALGSKLRAMAKVAGAGRGPAAALAKDLSMAPWQIDRARRDLQGWEPRGLRRAIVAVADADAAVKGEVPGVAAAYALERAVVVVTDARERTG